MAKYKQGTIYPGMRLIDNPIHYAIWRAIWEEYLGKQEET